MARSFATPLLLTLGTQILAPSNARATGAWLTLKAVVKLASYQCRRAIWSGLQFEAVTPSDDTASFPC
jgi:hypothetical protein